MAHLNRPRPAPRSRLLAILALFAEGLALCTPAHTVPQRD
jgi:hypothetical protein